MILSSLNKTSSVNSYNFASIASFNLNRIPNIDSGLMTSAKDFDDIQKGGQLNVGIIKSRNIKGSSLGLANYTKSNNVRLILIIRRILFPISLIPFTANPGRKNHTFLIQFQIEIRTRSR